MYFLLVILEQRKRRVERKTQISQVDQNDWQVRVQKKPIDEPKYLSVQSVLIN